LAAAITQCAIFLEIVECLRLQLRDFIPIKVKGCHPAQQKIGCFGTATHQLMDLGGGDTQDVSDTLHLRIGAAFQLR